MATRSSKRSGLTSWSIRCIPLDYRDFLELDDRFSQAHWLFQHNGGVFLPPWGKAEQWTLSVQHSEDDARRFVDNFETFARALRK
jgi:glutamate-1-semialdehyde 2,1-aminomutase